MAIQNAIRFIRKVQRDDEFRSELYSVSNDEEYLSFLKTKDLEFTNYEFEEGYNVLLGQCQFEEDHDALQNVVHLVNLLY